MKKIVLFFSIFLCSYSVAFAENVLLEEGSKKFIVSSKISTSSFESILLPLIESHGYIYRKDTKKIFEMYFDSPELIFLHQNQFLRYQAREYLSKKNKIKYHEEIQLLAKDNSEAIYPVKHYKRVQDYKGKHLLIGMVKRKVRPIFLNELKANGINYPLKLKIIFSLSKKMHAYAIYDDNIQIGSIIVTDIEVASQKKKISFSQVKEIPANPTANSDKLDLIYNELLRLYDVSPDIRDSKIDNDYSQIFRKMEEHFRFFHFMLKYPYITYILYSTFVMLIGLVLIKCLFWNRFFASE